MTYFSSKTTRTMPTPMMTMGLDKRFVAVDATPCTVFPATFATEPIDPVTLPIICPGIEIRLFKSPPVVLMICDGIPRMESRNIVLYIMEIKFKKKDDHIFILE